MGGHFVDYICSAHFECAIFYLSCIRRIPLLGVVVLVVLGHKVTDLGYRDLTEFHIIASWSLHEEEQSKMTDLGHRR